MVICIPSRDAAMEQATRPSRVLADCNVTHPDLEVQAGWWCHQPSSSENSWAREARKSTYLPQSCQKCLAEACSAAQKGQDELPVDLHMRVGVAKAPDRQVRKAPLWAVARDDTHAFHFL
mmetsp:Transcript_44962/g.130073  ORF Transcript_44962/g.130073 Transcript_44962/m.130073 type:complete len:120 (-) Transcript_44962:1756-2115(-)